MGRMIIAMFLLLWPMIASADPFAEAAGAYRITPESSVRFSVAQIGGAGVEGTFQRFSGTFHLLADVERSRVDFTVEPDSVRAADPRIEAFLRSESVFDSERFPSMVFRSSRIRRTGPDSASIEGRLTAKGVTRPARFAVRFSGQDSGSIRFHVTGKMSRALFNMDVGTPIYSNMVVLDMDLIGQRM